MKITEVKTKKDIADFYNIARQIYKNDKVWVCPLEAEIEGIFNPETNVFFKNGKQYVGY